MTVRRLPNDELYHHGILGQRWGVRRYQNADGSLTAAGKKKRGIIQTIKNKHKGRQLQKAKQKKKAEREAKEELIKSGDADVIRKNRNKLSDEELARAIERVKMNTQLQEYEAGAKKAQAEKARSYIENAASLAQTVSNFAQSASNVHNSLVNMGLIDAPKKKESGILKQIADINNETNLLNSRTSLVEAKKKYEKAKQKVDTDKEKRDKQMETAKWMSEYSDNVRKANENEYKNKIFTSGNDAAIRKLLKIEEEKNKNNNKND